jgi:hypothetical protein
MIPSLAVKEGYPMSGARVYRDKKVGSLIAILILVLPYDVWPPSIPGIASAINQEDSASQDLSNQPPPLPTETPKTSLEEKSGSEIHPNVKPLEGIPSRQDVHQSVDSKPAVDSGSTLVPKRDIAAEEKAELTETARLLAVLLDSGRIVVGRAQSAINNPRLEDKGFSIAVFEERLRKEFLTRTGHDLRKLAPAPMSVRAKVLLLRLAYFMQESVHEAQALINQKGIGFKGFIPATFATRVAVGFSKDTGITLRQIGPPNAAPRNPNNKPDEKEQAALLLMQKSHPRVGDHIVEQHIEDRGMRVLLPLFYNKQCLACHGQPKGQVDISGYEKEGFKEGDIGGAISVTVPIENEQSKADSGR